MWGEILTSPVAWGYIGSLIVLEGLLSADNALVLAILVKHLPAKKQKKALLYGLFGAYFFRFIFIGIGVFLIHFMWIKLLGAAYLAWIVIKHFWKGEGDEDASGIKKDNWLIRIFGMFWATVVTVELMDLTFSADSILAAFAVSDKVWILFLGGAIGILMMRTVASLFLILIEKVPELETTAFVLIAIIALKMGASVFGFDLNSIVFFTILVVSFLITFVVHFVNKQRGVNREMAASKEE